MKNKYIKMLLLIIVIIFMVLVGVFKINKYYDIIENAKEYKLSCSMHNIYSPHIRNGYIYVNIDSLQFPYTEKNSLVEDKIESEKQGRPSKEFPFNVRLNENVGVSVSSDENGFMKIDSFSEDTGGLFVIKLKGCNFVKWDKEVKKNVPLDEPYMYFDFANLNERMYFSEKSMLNLQKYINSIEQKNRQSHAIVKLLDNNIVITDVIVNGESLKEIANK